MSPSKTPDSLAAPAASSLIRTVLSKRSWISLGGVLLGGVVLGESQHLGSTGLTLLAAGTGWWWFSRRRGRPRPAWPRDDAGWIERCTTLLEQFERLEPEAPEALSRRRQILEQWQADRDRQALTLAVVGDPALLPAPAAELAPLLACSRALQIHLGHPLPQRSGDWRWPAPFSSCDALLYLAAAPLQASDLRWLTALPQGQPAWLLLRLPASLEPEQAAADLRSQLGGDVAADLLLWNGEPASLPSCLASLAAGLRRSPQDLIDAARLRSLQALHRDWQARLEQVRRRRFQSLQQRTQWLVAATVVASPLPTLDLMVVAIGNGLMLQEMAALWDCDWSITDLRAAAAELASASVALGVAEWSSQALLSVMRLHGATWLVGSALQALSAAYLTRVVAHAMADVMALSVGVDAPDLARIKREAPLLVARAAEAEQLDWPAFLSQARDWLQKGRGLGQAGT